MKHERDIVNGWRLRKTLRRKTEFRPIEDADCKFAWAAYRKGALASMGERFAAGMTPEAFYAAFVDEVMTNYTGGAWTLSAETKRGFLPVGIVLAFFSHPNPRLAPFMIVGDMIWMPWASPRNRIESAVGFFNAIRRDVPMVEYANDEAKPFFEMIAKHGIMRRVGTTFSVYPGQATAVFETRALETK